MASLLDIDWRSIFVPQGSVLGRGIRGTLMYVAMFALLHIFRRQAGVLSIADCCYL